MSKAINKKLAIAIAMLVAVFMFASVQNAYAADTVGKLDKPVIKLSLSDAKAFTVTAKKDVDATGYQIKYAKNSSFSSAKTVNVKGKKLSKKISKLTAGKKYYVKVRAYKTVDGKKTYGSWSLKKTITPKTYYYAYVKLNVIMANLQEKSNDATAERVPYNTKLKVVSKKKTTSGVCYKVKYNGNTRYIWEMNGKPKKLMPVQNTFDDYSVADNSAAQNAVLDKAVDILKNWNTGYKKNAYNDIRDGKHYFDCSGFVTYVYNETFGTDYPGYFLPHKTTEINKISSTGASTVETVCTSIDYSKMKPGDLILFKTPADGDGIVNHCGIYLGGHEFMHCNGDGVNVMTLDVQFGDWTKKVIRVIPE